MKKVHAFASLALMLGVLASCQAPNQLSGAEQASQSRDLYPASVQDLLAQITVVNPQGADTVELTWTNPVDPAYSGALVVRYTNVPPTGKPTDGKVYNIGQGSPELGTGVVVGFTSGTSYSEKIGYNSGPGTATYQVWAMNNLNQYHSTAPSAPVAVAQNEWADVGAPGFSNGFSKQSSMAFLSGQPYVSYLDESIPNAILVSRYDGVSWSAVGAPIVTTGSAYRPMLKMFQGQPHLVYVDDGVSSVNVKKFDGVSWVSVGAPNFASAYYSAAMAVGGSTLYVAFFGTVGLNNVGKVMKFDGVSWVAAAPAFYSHPTPSTPLSDMALSVYQGIPTVAYQNQDPGSSGVFVKKWNGLVWTTLSGSPVTSAPINNLSFCLDTQGTPHVLYVENPQNPVAHVKKFSQTTNSWIALGSWPTQNVQPTITCDYRIPTILLYQSLPAPGMYAKQLQTSGWTDLGTMAIGSSTMYPAFGLNSNVKPYVATGGVSGKMTVRVLDPYQ